VYQRRPQCSTFHHGSVVKSWYPLYSPDMTERFGYKPEDMVILTDDSRDPRTMPTKANIIKGMQWLVDGAHRDDALFLH